MQYLCRHQRQGTISAWVQEKPNQSQPSRRYINTQENQARITQAVGLALAQLRGFDDRDVQLYCPAFLIPTSASSYPGVLHTVHVPKREAERDTWEDPSSGRCPGVLDCPSVLDSGSSRTGSAIRCVSTPHYIL
eukprot:2957251-Rhodomonas_salina.1